VYESRRHRPVTRQRFLLRLVAHGGASAGLILGSLLAGMAGYSHYEGLAWRDAFLNASMLLGGMGPVEVPQTPGGKLFAGFYALWAGLIVIIAAGFLFAPVFHRIIHKFHWVEDHES
jgi:sterol desaturase/sphingolipid hydroxylase (fatty acid hydroxylase superfamily)